MIVKQADKLNATKLLNCRKGRSNILLCTLRNEKKKQFLGLKLSSQNFQKNPLRFPKELDSKYEKQNQNISQKCDTEFLVQ